MYLIAIAWLYVALMMAVAEATHSNGSVLGAVITFVLYGLGPVGLLMYLLGTPGRRAARRRAEAALHAGTSDGQSQPSEGAASSTGAPDRRAEPTGEAVPPVRKEL